MLQYNRFRLKHARAPKMDIAGILMHLLLQLLRGETDGGQQVGQLCAPGV